MRLATGLGQYVPVDSFVHALEPRAKMGLAAALTVALFVARDFAGLGALALLVALAVWMSRVPWRVALRGLGAIGVLLAFTLLAHALTLGSAHPLVHIGRLGVDLDGLRTGAFFVARIVLLVVGTSLLTLTTTPVALTDGLEHLLRPLRHVGVPAGDIAMMLTVALRFIPTTAEEAEGIVMAQQARGARFGEGGPVARVRSYVPVLVPLFVNLFRRADELATAMEARCYRGGESRTRLRETRMQRRDWVTLVAGATVLAAVAALF